MRLNPKKATFYPHASSAFPLVLPATQLSAAPVTQTRPRLLGHRVAPGSGNTQTVSRPLQVWILLVAAATLVLVGIGGLVTSHGVGMAVPDWPNTYGYNMFLFPISRWVGGIFYEHTHRLAASAVGLMTAIMAAWLYGRRARPLLRWMGIGLVVVAGLGLVVAWIRESDTVVLVVTGLASLTASFCWPRTEAAPSGLCRLGVIALVAVIVQGLLGGLRVILFRDELGIVHATLAQLFFVVICLLAVLVGQSHGHIPAPEDGRAPLNGAPPAVPSVSTSRWLFLVTTCLILLQLILGATMRHQHAGLAIPDFPMAYGRLWPATDPASVAGYNQQRLEVVSLNSITAFQINLQMVHRLVAVAILGAVAACAWKARRAGEDERSTKRLTFVWLGLVLTQALLGAATVWSNKAADIATAHVVGGALSLGLGAILCALSFRMPDRLSRSCEMEPAWKVAADDESRPPIGGRARFQRS